MNAKQINKFVMFGFNWNIGFIAEAWNTDALMSSHLQDKFSEYYKTVGPSAVMFKFWCALDETNRELLINYIDNNYK